MVDWFQFSFFGCQSDCLACKSSKMKSGTLNTSSGSPKVCWSLNLVVRSQKGISMKVCTTEGRKRTQMLNFVKKPGVKPQEYDRETRDAVRLGCSLPLVGAFLSTKQWSIWSNSFLSKTQATGRTAARQELFLCGDHVWQRKRLGTFQVPQETLFN